MVGTGTMRDGISFARFLKGYVRMVGRSQILYGKNVGSNPCYSSLATPSGMVCQLVLGSSKQILIDVS